MLKILIESCVILGLLAYTLVIHQKVIEANGRIEILKISNGILSVRPPIHHRQKRQMNREPKLQWEPINHQESLNVSRIKCFERDYWMTTFMAIQDEYENHLSSLGRKDMGPTVELKLFAFNKFVSLANRLEHDYWCLRSRIEQLETIVNKCGQLITTATTTTNNDKRISEILLLDDDGSGDRDLLSVNGVGRKMDPITLIKDTTNETNKKIEEMEERLGGIETGLKSQINNSRQQKDQLQSLIKQLSQSFIERKYNMMAINKTVEEIHGKLASLETSINRTSTFNQKLMADLQSTTNIVRGVRATQSDYFGQIQGFHVKVDHIENEINRFGYKLTTLQSDYLNSTLHLERGSQKDYSQDMEMAKTAQKVVDIDKNIHVLFAQLKQMEMDIGQRINYSQWKTLAENTEMLAAKQGETSDLVMRLANRTENITKAVEILEINLAQDCNEVKLGQSRVLPIKPNQSSSSFPVFCEGDWLIFQRRHDNSTNFNRTYIDYSMGFGKLDRDFWLGNSRLHTITSSSHLREYELRVETVDIYGEYRFADYSTFEIRSATEGYRLKLGQWIDGNLSDSLASHNEMRFSAFNVDQDTSSTNCARYYAAGWWYSNCQKANLNGNYNIGIIWFNNITNEWLQLRRTQMKIRRK